MTGPEFSDAVTSKGVRVARDEPLCGGDRKHGAGPCEQHAGWGTDHPSVGRCKLHGGSTPNHRKSAQEQQARQQAARLGVPVVTTGTAAVEHALALAHGTMLYAAQLVADLAPERLVVLDKSGQARTSGQVAFFQEALRDYARQAKDVVSLGLDTQRVQLEERRVDVMIGVLRRVLEQVQERVESRLGHQLPELAGEIVGPLVHAALTEAGGEVV